MLTSLKCKKYFSPQQNVDNKHQAKAHKERVGCATFVVVVRFQEHFVTDDIEHNAARKRGSLMFLFGAVPVSIAATKSQIPCRGCGL